MVMPRAGMFDDFIVRQPDLANLGRVDTDTDTNTDAEAGAGGASGGGGSKYPRRFGRLPQETLSCNLGEVLDLSAGGMRIGCRRVPTPGSEPGATGHAGNSDDSDNADHPGRGLLTIHISDHPMSPPLTGRIVWTKKTGWIRHEFGVAFEGLSSEQSEMLSEIAMVYRERRSM